MTEPSVFLSWTRLDAGDGPHNLAAALEAEGIRVWIDDHAIDPFDGISSSIREGLSSCHVFVAWYTRGYATRRACREELTSALLGAMRAGHGPERVLVVNPEPDLDHVLEAPLLDQRFAGPGDLAPEAIGRLAGRIARRTREVDEPLRAVSTATETRWYGGAGWHGADPSFVGRLTELWQIYDRLHRVTELTGGARAGRQVAYLSGLGGVGKSLLAAEYAHRFSSLYSGGVVWLNALGRDTSGHALPGAQSRAAAESAITDLATWLGLDVAGAPPDTVREAVKGAIEARALPMLWVVDDLPSGLSEAELDDWRCSTPFTHEVITSRDRGHSRLQPLVLEMLSGEEATTLVLAGRDLDHDEMAEAAALAEDLGRHPLACHVAGRFIARTSSVGAYRKLVRRDLAQFDALAALLGEELPGDHSRLITATLATSLAALGPSAWQLLRIASQLAPAPIPLDLLGAGLAAGDPERENTEEFRLVAEAVHDRRGDGLWESDGDGLRVHVLVLGAAMALDPEPERVALVRLGLLEYLGGTVAEAAVDVRQHRAVAAYAVHARHFVADLLDAGRDAQRSATRAEDEQLALLGLALGRYDHEAGRYSAARAVQQASHHELRRIRGEDDEWTLTAANDLATTVRELGELRAARDLHATTYKRRIQVLGRSHSHTLISANNLAEVLAELGELASAQALHARTYETLRASVGDRHPHTLISANNLAVALRKVGDQAASQELHRATLEAMRDVLGADHPDTLTSISNLGEVARELGDLTAARDLHQEAYETRLRVQGEDHPDTQVSANNLALTLADLGDLASALRVHESVYDVLKRSAGPRHPATITAATNLALCRLKAHDLTGAATLLRTVRGDAHAAGDAAAVLTVGDALAVVLRIQNDEVAEVRVLRENHELRRQALGEEHEETLRNAVELAEALLDLGELDEAERLYWATWRGLEDVLGPDHPEALRCATGVAQVKLGHGAFGRAIEILEHVVNVRRRVLGPAHEDTRESEEMLERVRALYRSY